MSQGIYEDVIDSIRRDLDEHAAGLTEEVDRVIEEWETRGHHDDIRKTNTPPKVIFNARNLQADPMPQFNLVKSFADKSNIRRLNPDALSQLKKIRRYTTEWYSLGSCFENIDITSFQRRSPTRL